MTPPPRITLKTLSADFFRDFSELDRGMLGTVRNLFSRPSRVIDSYLYIDRERFIRPTRYLIFCFSLAALQTFVTQSWYGQSVKELSVAAEAADELAHPGPRLGKQVDGVSVSDDSKQAPLGPRFTRLLDKADHFFSQFRTFAALILMPLLALLYYYFYGRHGYNLAESIVATTYLTAHVSLLGFLFLPFYFAGSTPEDYEFWSSTENLFTGVYLLIAATKVFAQRWWETLVAFVWGGFLLVFLGLMAKPIIFFLAVVTRILYEMGDLGAPSLSWQFISSALQVIVVLPTVIYLFYRLHPLRKKASVDRAVLQWILLILLLLGLIAVNYAFDQFANA